MKKVFVALSAGALTAQAGFRPIVDPIIARPIDEPIDRIEPIIAFPIHRIIDQPLVADSQFVNIQQILGDVGQGVQLASAFVQAVQDWETVQWSTGNGILQSVQETAQAVTGTWGEINTITGGSFNQDALNAVAKLAGGNFPTAKIANVAGKMIMTVAGQATDITTAVMAIKNGVEQSNWGQVLPNIITIAMQMVGDVENDDQFVNIQQILGDLGQGVTLASSFVQAVQDWENVQWSTGNGILQSVQETAQAVTGTWGEINTITGGSFNQDALNAVAKLAGGNFPTAKIANVAGKMIMTVAGQATDITTAVMAIKNGVEQSNWGQVLPNIITIAMQMVGDVENDDQLFNLGSLMGDIGQGIGLAGDFVNAVQDWENVNWSTANGILQAVQATASAVDGSWNEINSVTGGAASQGALNAIAKVAGGNFPTTTIVNDSGRFIMSAAGQSVDVTTEINNISSGVQSGNWGEVLPNIIQLCMQIIGDVQQDTQFVDIQQILGDIGQGVTLASSFVQAVQDWENVQWNTGNGILQSVQETAQAVTGTWGEINTITGGSFNQDALNAVAKLAGGKFPTAKIANVAGKMIMTVAGQATDITTAVIAIKNGVEQSNWGQVLPNIITIAMQMVGDVENANN